MSTVTVDTYGHIESPPGANVMAAGAVSTVAAGTIAPTTNSGANPTVTAVTANDNYGSFVLTPVTGGGAQSAGAQAVVTFAQSMRKTPVKVLVTVTNTTVPATPAAVAAYATAVTSNGFSVTTPALTTANTYLVTYDVSL